MKHLSLFTSIIVFLSCILAILLAYYMGLNTVNKSLVPSNRKITYVGNENDLFINGNTYKESLYADLAVLPISQIVHRLEDLRILQSKNLIESTQTNIAEGVVLKIDTTSENKKAPFVLHVTIGSINDSVNYMYKTSELSLVNVYSLNKNNVKTKSSYETIKKGDYISIKEITNLKTQALVKSEIIIQK